MEFTTEVVASAVVSEIVGRIFSYVIDSFLSSRGHARDAHRQRLEALLLDIGCKVEEAEGRHITNIKLLGQLQAVTDAMHRGRFALEVADLDDGDVDDVAASAEEEASTTGKRKLVALCSPLNVVKRARLILGGGGGGSATTEKRLAAVVKELEDLMRRDHMRSFMEMVMGYPRRNNVPRAVTTTLSTGLSVLAVVGDRRVGKTTLVKHACHDERVRGHFTRVEWFSSLDVLKAGAQPGKNPRTGRGPEYLTGMRRILDEPRFRAVGGSLLVFDDSIPIDESRFRELLATNNLAEGSKLIFTSINADFARIIGTMEPVVLRPLPEEEYWYYFKAFAFGGADPQDHQRIAAVGREISRHLGRSFVDAVVLGELLRANFNARFWHMVLAAVFDAIKRRGNCGPFYCHVVGDLLYLRGWNWMYGCHENEIPPKTKLTLPDVLRAAATSSSGSDLSRGHMEGAFTIHCSPGLYRGSYTIVFLKDGWTVKSRPHMWDGHRGRPTLFHSPVPRGRPSVLTVAYH
ncbi:hypothetical protein EJB05_44642, partial [Eragrostis curvula]